MIGHFQIRNRGTVGGSIAHADPASELPAVALALDAELEAAPSRLVPTHPGRRLLRRHLDHHTRARRGAHRGPLPGVGGSVRVRRRRDRPPQRRLRTRGRRLRGRAERRRRGQPLRDRALRDGSDARPCTSRPRPRCTAPTPTAADLEPRSGISRPRVAPRATTCTRRPSTGHTWARTSCSARSTEHWEKRGVAEQEITLTVNGERRHGRAEAAQDARRLPPGRPRAHRDAPRVRARRVWRVHRARRRRRGARVSDVRGAGRGRRRGDDRGDRPCRRLARPGAGGVPPGARAAVRLLHARLRRQRARLPPAEPEPHARRDPRRPVGQPLPLHRLPGDHQGRADRGGVDRAPKS